MPASVIVENAAVWLDTVADDVNDTDRALVEPEETSCLELMDDGFLLDEARVTLDKVEKAIVETVLREACRRSINKCV
jgi:hypothetical protein